ncbi:hypothetical protein BDV3_002291 [Batrachochytrium dendrobatidis]
MISEEALDNLDDWTSDSSFDSEAGTITKSAAKQKLADNIRNADAFYDEEIDEADERWMQRQHQKGSKTDAMLLCPLCFTPVCYDCQQHQDYGHQFRAIFVENCRVIETEILHYPNPTNSSSKKPVGKNFKKSSPNVLDSSLQVDTHTDRVDEKSASLSRSRKEDIYHPVRCNTCDCEVAVYDHEEVYHFFNVIAQ